MDPAQQAKLIPPAASTTKICRRQAARLFAGGAALLAFGKVAQAATVFSPPKPADKSQWKAAIKKGLDWVAKQQSRSGGWPDKSYPVAITALAGTALISSGSKRDQRYTYGHGFSMLFLSQVLGEEEDVDRRTELIEALKKAVSFSVSAQTKAGGWGYVSSKSSSFDEGSTTITQVQGLRGCRNAGLAVPKEAIEKAKKYIYDCQNADGGISYSFQSRGSSRPAITAAALAALYNAGDYESDKIPPMWDYCKARMHNLNKASRGSHWHYTYLYYAQVVYRQGASEWQPFRDKLYRRLVGEQQASGGWKGGSVSELYTSAMNLIILQLDNGYLPIYQR